LRELALHILDIAENSISAGADQIKISVCEHFDDDRLVISIEDNGKGMDQETLTRITDPFITSRTTRKVGLGIPFLKAAAEICDGTFDIQSTLGAGTTVQAAFKHSHIDRMPLGDISATLQTLIIGTPDVNWVFEYHVDENSFIFNDKPIKDTLDGVPLSEPAVIKFIREMLDEGIENVRQNAMSTITTGN
jgi:anti-sigma regulatory factor (Ser/Thr protein kinase)